jgi:serine/threonine-protein kinase
MIKKRGRFDIDEGIGLIVQACAGIGYAHRAGLVHCDVKPHNFLVTPDNRLKVTDFGIARALASISPDEESDVIWGSPQYFSPEQAAGNAPSPASDVYSLGVIMYHMFTGQLPFMAKTSSEMARLHRRARPINPRELNPFIPPVLEEIILKVLSKEPAARYRTADQLGRVLLTFTSKAERAAPQAQPIAPPTPQTEAPPQTESRTDPQRQPDPSKPIHTNSGRLASRTAPEPYSISIDWVAVGLGLLMVLSVGGLLPFWMWVYFVFNPPR